MEEILHKYKIRLTNLSQNNRSLKLGQLSRRRDVDLKEFDFLENKSAEKLLESVVKGRSVTLISKLNPLSETVTLLERRLNNIYREVNTLFEESGAYDLFVGFPFVQGKFTDGTVVRCPLLLFPVKLVRDYRKSPRWKLECNKEDDVFFNKTFFLAYEKYQRSQLGKEFWDTNPEHFEDIQTLLNWLFSELKQKEVELQYSSQLFNFLLDLFPDMNSDRMNEFPEGVMKLKSHAVLGIFPQSNSALVQDYDLLEKDAIKYRVSEFLDPEIHHSKKEIYIPEEKRFFVADVDQSQEEALLKIKNGKSVVLHGPPGTGKSQVILNIVADALATGKKILVVSQKRAALDVVFERMTALGLHRYAALVHDYRSDRSKIFSKLRKQIEDIEQFKESNKDLGLTKLEYDFRQLSRQIDRHVEFFDELKEALTRKRSFGFDVHSLYLLAKRDVSALSVREYAHSTNYEQLEEALRKIRDLLEYKEYFLPNHPWQDRLDFTKFKFEDRGAMKEFLQLLPNDVLDLHQDSLELKELTENVLNVSLNEERISHFETCFKQLEEDKLKAEFTALYHGLHTPQSALDLLEKFNQLFEQIKLFSILNENEWERFFDLNDHFEHYFNKKDDFTRFFSLDYLKATWFLKEIFDRKEIDFSEQNVATMKQEVGVLKRLMNLYHKFEKSGFIRDLPLTCAASDMLEWGQMKIKVAKFALNIEQTPFYEILKPKVVHGQFDEIHWANAKALFRRLSGFNQKLKEYLSEWSQWLSDKQLGKLLPGVNVPSKAEKYVEQLSTNFDFVFEDLISLDRFLNAFDTQENLLQEAAFKTLIRDEENSPESFLQWIRNSVYLTWIALAEEDDPQLVEVSSRMFENRCVDFKSQVKERESHVLKIIHSKLEENILSGIKYNRLKNPITYRPIAHQVNKKRRIWPVRKLLAEFWEDGLSDLMPCWLASPEAVAALFPLDKKYFDLVVFDEASQCYVERALPVMLRGNNCVVAGDDKQLPPFDLYSIKAGEEEEDVLENEMALEVESALDLAKNIFDECKLTWHYRSQEEELINFSNHYFYHGQLNVIPPPSINPLNVPPIERIKVEGIWQNNRNIPEADRVIKLVLDILQRPDHASIGIVTFNYHQQELIKDKLEQCLMDVLSSGDKKLSSKLYQALNMDQNEEYPGIFVKNIENVQGDERDVIIFSTAYARNESGKMNANFGLLNQKGGENRLNVAITRARQKIYLVCSFEPEELKVEDAKNRGPKLFKKYIEYARAVSELDKERTNEILSQLNSLSANTEDTHTRFHPHSAETSLTEMIRDKLKELNIHPDTHVGDTKYKLDLAIKGSTQSGYSLGIECEGPVYFSGKTAKEREIYRHHMLISRGWNLHRVWARNYFLNSEKEIQNIIKKLKNGYGPDAL